MAQETKHNSLGLEPNLDLAADVEAKAPARLNFTAGRQA